MKNADALLPAEEKSILHLLNGTLRTAIFSILVGFLLVLYLLTSQVPIGLLASWYFLIIGSNSLRFYLCRRFIKNRSYVHRQKSTVVYYTMITTFVALVWGISYLIFIPYVSPQVEIIIMLVLGGMAAGAMGTLAAFLPAYYLFTFALFLPAITNILMDFNKTNIFLVTVIIIYALTLFMQAHIIRNVLFKTYVLTFEKDALIQQLSKYVEKLKLISVTDPLTGLYNRRFFDKTLKTEINRTRRNQELLSLLVIDVDKFKYINDHYGHPYGDKFLIHLAELMKTIFKRSSDMVFRIGGDEFAVILINQNLPNTHDIAKKLCNELKKQELPTHVPSIDPANLYSLVGLSIGGINLKPEEQCSPEELFLKADMLLYQVKIDKDKNILLEPMTGACS